MSSQPEKKFSSPPPEETGHADDAVIGRAFRGSALAFALLALGAGALIWWLQRKPAPGPEQKTILTAPVAPALPAAVVPVMKFTDVTASAGVTFRHFNGAQGEKLLPETMGGGVACFDADGDGDQDLLFVNSAPWPWATNAPAQKPTPALYLNDGKGNFTDATKGSGLDASFYGMGAAAGDFDNDGRVDLFLTGVGQSRLFHNLGGGKFRDVTASADVGGAAEAWATSAAFLDFDRDGDLDLFVCHYVKWSRAIDFEVGYKLVGVGRAYGQPMNFEGQHPAFYRNDGGGKFTDVSEKAGVRVKNKDTGVAVSKGLGVAPIDLDADGWPDVVVANDTTPNFVLHNQRDGTFKEIGAVSAVAFDNNGNTRGAMGIDAAFFRDGTLGIAIGNFANEMTALYVAKADPLTFTDDAIPEGIGPASRRPLKFGVFFFDYDLDGRLDLLTANGHLEEEISKIQQSQTYAQPAQLFWNTGARTGATFTPVGSEQAGTELFRPIVGRGSAFGDLDGDGDLDAVLTQINGPPLVLRNDQSLGHHWLRVKLVGTKSNRDALGARVTLTVAGRRHTRVVTAARSYLSQSELPVTFGLGPDAAVAQLEILWPDGEKQSLTPAQVDRLITVKQGESVGL